MLPVPRTVRVGALIGLLPPLYPLLSTVSCCVVCPINCGVNWTLMSQGAAEASAKPSPQVELPNTLNAELVTLVV